jgi:hypothetical protein
VDHSRLHGRERMREVEASQRVKERGGGLTASEGERWQASAGIGWSNAKRSGQAG